MGLVIRLVVNAVALYAVSKLVPGVEVTGITGTIVAAAVLGIVNAIIRPILIILSLPAEILTLGLFTFVINAALFWFVGHLGLGLVVRGFGAAFVGAIVLGIISFVLSLIVGPTDRPARVERRR